VPPNFTVMLCVVAPVLQRLPVALELVSVTESPLHSIVGPDAVMIGGVGVGWTRTVSDALSTQPNPSIAQIWNT
jgi:hypothetical protein